MFKNRALAAIFLVIFIDLLGFSLILPLLPYYAATFKANSTQTGLLVAVYAAAQFIAAPFFGRFSDRWGRRPVLLFSLAGNIFSFILLAMANSLWVLFAARIVSGIIGSNISVAQAYISDVTDASNRAQGLGLVGAAFGLGFIFGPALGGFLSQWGYGVPAVLAAVLSLVNLVMVLFWLPESLTAERRAALSERNRVPISVKSMLSALRRPVIGPLLNTRFVFALAFALFQTIFSLWGLRRFALSAQQTGYILAYVGVLSALVQGVLIGRLSRRYTERFLIFSATVLMAAGLLGWALAPSVWFLLVDLIPIAVAGGVLNTIINSVISKSVEPAEVGGILGVSASLESLTRVFAPTLGGVLLDQSGTQMPGLVAAALLGGLSIYIWTRVFYPRMVRFQAQPDSVS
jgi:DHA1 family tetracycline resistance protein-like MFS transporter